jgi:hypothetical protein
MTAVASTAKVLVKFQWDCGHMGALHGLFVTTPDILASAIGQSVNFGRIMGQHIPVRGPLYEGDFTVVSTDQVMIQRLEACSGASVCGYNPLAYLEPESKSRDTTSESSVA